MQETRAVLIGEYVKRIFLDSLDRQMFLDFIEGYRKGSQVDFNQIKQDGQLERYDMLAYLTTSSALKRSVFEETIGELAGNEKHDSDNFSKRINELKELQQKVLSVQQKGGFFDELEATTDENVIPRSSLIVGGKTLDTSNQTIEEQIATYKKGLKDVLENSLTDKSSQEEVTRQLSEICQEMNMYQKDISQEVENSVRSSYQKGTKQYQKILTM